VLCPGFVKTRIHESRRNRPASYGAGADATEFDGQMTQPVLTGLDVGPIAERVLEAVVDNEFYVFTHPEMRSAVEERFAAILAAFDRAAASPTLTGAPRAPIVDVATVALGPG
jgi:hypothetical protein